MPHASEAVHYKVEVANLHAHLYAVTLTIARPNARQILRLPAWIPGSYLVREFARNLQNLRAMQGRRQLELLQLNKDSWQLEALSSQPLIISYQVYAYDQSVRTAWLDVQRGFFNGTSLFLRAEGHTELPHSLQVARTNVPADWKLATGLKANRQDSQGFGRFSAPNYDALADCPVEMGNFWSASFTALDIPHRFVVSGAATPFDEAKLLADTKNICEAQIRFWHSGPRSVAKTVAPMSSFLFLLNVVPDGHGGLEHRNSTALIAPRKSLPAKQTAFSAAKSAAISDAYQGLLGLISHEYFHTWNVKALRPAEFENYDYSRENYTELLWFFEGFTSYYDDLMLRRSHRIDTSQYLKLLAKCANQVWQTPGRKVQSLAKASWDAWIKYYRPDENTPNATVSYYTKGALVALCLDLTLRQEGCDGLDSVMRDLWVRCEGGPMREQDLQDSLMKLGKRSFGNEIRSWVHGTDDLPVIKLLEQQGVQVHQDKAPLAQRLGVRVKESGSIILQNVFRGGAAELAGMASGDEWIGVQTRAGSWRVRNLDDVVHYCGDKKSCVALVARDDRILKLALALDSESTAMRFTVRDSNLVNRWLDS